jgi:RNA polymerase sigma factor (TIGR02999 family)
MRALVFREWIWYMGHGNPAPPCQARTGQEAQMTPAAGDVTQLLAALQNGRSDAASQLIPLVYEELHRLARQQMRRERPDHTLQATALLHEAYLRLVNQPERTWQNRTHFIAIAAQVMRRILVDHGRARRTAKRDGMLRRVALNEPLLITRDQPEELLALNDALERLAQLDARQSRVVELRYFGGLTVDETAAALGTSPRTVKREWRVARAWLHREVQKNRGDDA